MFNDIALFVIFAVVLIAMARPLGTYMADVFLRKIKGAESFFASGKKNLSAGWCGCCSRNELAAVCLCTFSIQCIGHRCPFHHPDATAEFAV